MATLYKINDKQHLSATVRFNGMIPSDTTVYEDRQGRLCVTTVVASSISDEIELETLDGRLQTHLVEVPIEIALDSFIEEYESPNDYDLSDNATISITFNENDITLDGEKFSKYSQAGLFDKVLVKNDIKALAINSLKPLRFSISLESRSSNE